MGRKMWCENDKALSKFEPLDLMMWGPKERNDRFHLKILFSSSFLFTADSFSLSLFWHFFVIY